MKYNDALDYIHSTYKFGIKVGLENINKLLELLGNPQDSLRFVHVAGTNGKGSTASYINYILIESGYKTGLYTSPYLQSFTERIRIDNVNIPEDRLARITERVKLCVDKMIELGYPHPTEFEIVTSIAFCYYYEEKCDIVVLEVGLGGRFDSTNVIKAPLVAVITRIDYDHMQYLGNSLREIAYEKAGIIKNGSDVVIYPQEEEAYKEIAKKCDDEGCKLVTADLKRLSVEKTSIDEQVFSWGLYENIKIKLIGEYQILNAITAILTCECLNNKGLNISQDSILIGLSKTTWPGRFEVIKKDPYFIIDGAHNVNAVVNFVKTFNELFKGKKATIIFGVMKDKQYIDMIEKLVPIADNIITVTPNNERAISAEELQKIIIHYCKKVTKSDTIKEAVKTSLEITDTNGIICALGSLYYIGEIRSDLLKS